MPDPSSNTTRAPIIIVGAGPVGLSLALGLARQGVRSIIVERNEGTSERSKAPAIQLRTREVFRQWGVEARFLEAGTLRQSLALHTPELGRGPLLSFDFADLEPEADRPGLLVLEQGITEKLLLQEVQASGMCEVRFNAEAVGLKQNDQGVTLAVRDASAEQALEADFVVGCDGAGSFVRRALELPFEGHTYSVRPMLADIRVTDERDALPWPRTLNARGGVTTGIRLQPGVWRLIRLETGEPAQGEQVSDEEVRQRMVEVLGEGPLDVVWANRFRIHLRSSPRFRVGRVLLAGDAAHVHSPVGGLGMNGGIQDAHNLAWKLSHALRGGAIDRLLDAYHVERKAVMVQGVSRYTDLMTRLFLQAPSFVRTSAFALLGLIVKVPYVRRRMLRRATMIDLAYPASPLLDPSERAAGVRLPNPLLYAADGRQIRLYDLLPNGPVLLDLSDAHAHEVHAPVERVIRIGAEGFRDPSGLLRGLLAQGRGHILVRPDAHIAWARSHLDGADHAVTSALGL